MKKMNLLQTVLLLFVLLMSEKSFGQTTPNMYFLNGNVGIGYAMPKASLVVTKGTGEWGTALFGGSVNSSHFNWGAGEDWYIRGGKSGSNIIINDYPGAGNVGIGTATPTEKLHINGNVKIQNANEGIVFCGTGEKIIGTSDYGIQFQTQNGTPRMTISNAGNVTIGSQAPIGNFDVMGMTVLRGTDFSSFFNAGSGNTYIRGGNNGSYVLINDNPALGKVGIGITENYLSKGDRKLYVGGGIIAESVEVQLASGWSDFVFAKEYKLKPLHEVEQFISENKHLPDVPSEKEVKKDGINLGKMDATLLQKVEELTLYLIEQNKRIEHLEQQNKELLKQLKK